MNLKESSKNVICSQIAQCSVSLLLQPQECRLRSSGPASSSSGSYEKDNEY